MKNVRKAFRRFAHAKSDHNWREYRGAGRIVTKARRKLDEAVIAEQLEDDTIDPEPTEADVTFRLVLTTQVYENYGAHDWDGIGECPRYWKAKGGNEYQTELGSANDVIDLGAKGLERKANELIARTERADDYFDESVIGWEIVPSNVQTYDEKLRDMFGFPDDLR